MASLRLTQGHVAWDGQIPEWGNGFDAALRYYQHALIYALRYNRFLLDEALSGRPQGTPLRPIIPHCMERSEEGRRMLVALRNWWQTGANDIGAPRSDTISPIPEGIPLLEAERIATNASQEIAHRKGQCWSRLMQHFPGDSAQPCTSNLPNNPMPNNQPTPSKPSSSPPARSRSPRTAGGPGRQENC